MAAAGGHPRWQHSLDIALPAPRTSDRRVARNEFFERRRTASANVLINRHGRAPSRALCRRRSAYATRDGAQSWGLYVALGVWYAQPQP